MSNVAGETTAERLAGYRAALGSNAGLRGFISLTREAAAPSGRGPVVAVKDNIDVQAMPTSNGTSGPASSPAFADAIVVERIRQSDGVVIGKTNLNEFAFGVTGDNPWFGPVVHPLDPARLAGGSSSGSALAVAAGVCDWSLGTDTGGSLRIPAAFCGVFALKPTAGSLPMAGIRPLAPTLDTVGPIARTIDTLEEAWGIISGTLDAPVSGDEGHAQAPAVCLAAGWTRGLEGLDEDCRADWAELTARVDEIDFLAADEVTEVGRTILLSEASRTIVRRPPPRQDDDCLEVSAQLAEGRLMRSDGRYESALRRRETLIADFDACLQGIDALLLPVTGGRAPLRGSPAVRAQLTRYTRLANVVGAPALSLPIGGGKLPFGVQLVGARGGDARLISIARQFAAAHSRAAKHTG